MKPKKESKYKAFFPVITIQKNGKKQRVKILSIVFLVVFIIYVVVSLISVWFETGVLFDPLTEISDFLLMFASVVISIIALQVGDIYNNDVETLLNDIIEKNKNLKLPDIELQNTPYSNNIISILCIINICFTIFLFITNTVFQIIELFSTELTSCFNTIFTVNVIIIDILMVLLNILSVFDCVNSANNYKTIILDIKKINQQLFNYYNKLEVDKNAYIN